WNALRLGPVNFRAASLNDAITSSVRTFIIPSPGPAVESETTTEGSRTENSNHAETILRGFPNTQRGKACTRRKLVRRESPAPPEPAQQFSRHSPLTLNQA